MAPSSGRIWLARLACGGETARLAPATCLIIINNEINDIESDVSDLHFFYGT